MNNVSIQFLGEQNFFMQEAYKFLRTNMQFSGADKKVFAFTSCYENEGKSTVTLGISKCFAEMGKRTLFIDTDMRKSVLASKVNGNISNPGLSEMLSGMTTSENIITSTNVENLFVVFVGRYPPNPAELLSSDVFSDFIAECKQNFDYIIIDTPPLGVVSDAAIVASVSDGVVLVVGNNKLNRKDALDVIACLEGSNTPIIGIVRNMCHRKSKFGYYNKSYKSYYSNKYYAYQKKPYSKEYKI